MRFCDEPLVDEDDFVIAHCRIKWGTEHSHSDLSVQEMVWSGAAEWDHCPECTDILSNSSCGACGWPWGS